MACVFKECVDLCRLHQSRRCRRAIGDQASTTGRVKPNKPAFSSCSPFYSPVVPVRFHLSGLLPRDMIPHQQLSLELKPAQLHLSRLLPRDMVPHQQAGVRLKSLHRRASVELKRRAFQSSHPLQSPWRRSNEVVSTPKRSRRRELFTWKDERVLGFLIKGRSCC